MMKDMRLHKTLAAAKSLAIHLVAYLFIFNQATSLPVKTSVAAIMLVNKPNPIAGCVKAEAPAGKARKSQVNPTKKTLPPLEKQNKPEDEPSLDLKGQEFGLGSGPSLDPDPVLGEVVAIQIRLTPVLINKEQVRILYPEKAKIMMLEGSVLLRLTVSEQGRVVKAEVLSGHYDLRKAALKLADKLFFLPATDEEGHGKMALVEHEVVFRLRQSS